MEVVSEINKLRVVCSDCLFRSHLQREETGGGGEVRIKMGEGLSEKAQVIHPRAYISDRQARVLPFNVRKKVAKSQG